MGEKHPRMAWIYWMEGVRGRGQACVTVSQGVNPEPGPRLVRAP